MRALSFVLSVLLITSQILIAQVPQTTSFQGVLTDSEGVVVVDRDYPLSFRLYDSATNGTMLWEESQIVSTVGGVFSAILGSVTPLDLSFDNKYWLEMSIDGGEALSPRVELTSSFYSLMSKSVEDSTISTLKLQDNSVTTEKLSDGSVTQAKLASGVSLPAGGTAGGDLVGSYPNPSIAENAVNSSNVEDNTLTSDDIVTNVLSSIDGVDNDGGDVDLVAGSNISITPNNEANTITISANGVGGGDITSVTAGEGLTGGGSSGDITVNVVGGDGITVTADEVALNTAYTDGRYVNAGEANSVTSAMITDGQINTAELASNSVNSSIIIDNTVTSADIATNILSSIDGVSNDGGNVDLVAGSNVTITPNDGANTITISAATAAGDNLGNHSATQNIELNGNYLSGDGGNEGVFVTSNGNVGVKTNSPRASLDVEGINGVLFTGNSGSGSMPLLDMVSGVAAFLWYPKKSALRAGYVSENHWADNLIGNFSTAFGVNTKANGSYSTASGYFTTASGNASTAFGEYSYASGNYSTALGSETSAIGDYSTAIGYYTNCKSMYSTAIGRYNVGGGTATTWIETDPILEIGIGTSASATKNALTILKNGNVGIGTASPGTLLHVQGSKTKATLGSTIDGVQGESSVTGGSGVAGINTGSGNGIYGRSTSGKAGKFDGDVEITGNLSKGSGTFKIDHPLDPRNKYLYHSFVESPDMMNIYNGNVTTDGNGNADVELPEWFDALNKDFRYQLTVVGEFAQAIVSEKINNNRFSIRTDKPNIEVSWLVTGVRNDAYARAYRIRVEEIKPEKERGKYLHPEVFEIPVTKEDVYKEKYER